MKSKFCFVLCLSTLILVASSCVTAKKVRYLSDMPKEGMPINENFEVTVSPYDELAINVLSNGNEEELLKPFNASIGVTYLVDGKGNIQFPVLGELHVEGLTRLQLQDTLCTRLVKEGHLKTPMAQVKFMNFRVFFLNSSGGYVVNVENERCTFLEALAMSGGLDYYTRRDRIGVMREVNGKRIVHYLDPRSTAIFDDEFFLLQQNDIIFTEESRFSFFKENVTSWAMILSSLTSLGMVYLMAKSLSTK